MKIAFLLDNAYGIGGTIRSTVNLSRALADRHTVEVVSLRRTVEEPSLPFDTRVTMTELIDLRRGSPAYDGNDPLFKQPSERFTEGADHHLRGIATSLGDVRVAEFLRVTDADVVIATRPKINDYLAAYGQDRYLRIGQEHLTHTMHSDHIRSHQDTAIAQLDAFVTVSYADAAHYRDSLPFPTLPQVPDTPGSRGDAVVVTCVPNAVPATDVEPSDGQSKLIVAAGRLIKVKRYDRLLKAFALVSERHPDWRLRLYGRGRQQEPLRATIDRLGLYDRAYLMGACSPIETEWAKGAVAAVSSDGESFGMTLVEAMHCGVPVVSTDCPYGPGEIISHGEDGLLSPLGDEKAAVRAYADALLQLIENPEQRQRMSQAAREKAARYAPERIATEYEQLIERLTATRPAAPTVARGTGHGAPSAPQRRQKGGRPEGRPESPPGGRPESPPAGTSRPQPAAAPAPHANATPDAAPLRPRRTLRARSRRLLVRAAGPVLLPLVRRVRGSSPPSGSAAAMRRPLARVRAAEDGSLVVRLLASRLPKRESALLLRARRDDDAAPLRLRLPPRSESVDGWVEVCLKRGTHHLPEGRWDTYVERGENGKRKRVRSQLIETARLLSMPAPLDAGGALAPWVPYTTADGYLAVRAWHRAGHAEVISVDLGRDSCTVRARLYGSAAGTHPDMGSVVAVSRREAEPGFELPVAPVTAPGGGGEAPEITFEMPYELPAALDSGSLHGVWDLRFRPLGGGGKRSDAVRVGRLLGDIADRKKTDVLPCARLGETEIGVQPYFSLSNDLVIMLQPLPLGKRTEVTAAPAAAAAQPAKPAKPAAAEAGATAGAGAGADAGARSDEDGTGTQPSPAVPPS
jgi:glycosyltransferase involved in cell wall biosynthesis